MKNLIFVLMAGLMVSGVVFAKQQQWGNNVSFEMVISRDGQPKTTYKMWIKGDNMRMETIEHDDHGNTRKAISLMKMKLDPATSSAPLQQVQHGGQSRATSAIATRTM